MDETLTYMFAVVKTVRRILLVTGDTILPPLPIFTYNPVAVMDVFLAFGEVLQGIVNWQI